LKNKQSVIKIHKNLQMDSHQAKSQQSTLLYTDLT
jgi:hypothetical protein